MKGKERGRKDRKSQSQKEKTLGGVVEKEGGLRGTALSVQFKKKKNKTKKKLELNDVSNV